MAPGSTSRGPFLCAAASPGSAPPRKLGRPTTHKPQPTTHNPQADAPKPASPARFRGHRMSVSQGITHFCDPQTWVERAGPAAKGGGGEGAHRDEGGQDEGGIGGGGGIRWRGWHRRRRGRTGTRGWGQDEGGTGQGGAPGRGGSGAAPPQRQPRLHGPGKDQRVDRDSPASGAETARRPRSFSNLRPPRSTGELRLSCGSCTSARVTAR